MGVDYIGPIPLLRKPSVVIECHSEFVKIFKKIKTGTLRGSIASALVPQLQYIHIIMHIQNLSRYFFNFYLLKGKSSSFVEASSYRISFLQSEACCSSSRAPLLVCQSESI